MALNAPCHRQRQRNPEWIDAETSGKSAVKARRQRQRNFEWIDAETSVDVCCPITVSAFLQGLALTTEISGCPSESPMTLGPGATSPMHPG
eukprot:3722059-Alexandrium_andersonii.AAC.1